MDKFSWPVPFSCLDNQLIEAVALLLSFGASSFIDILITFLKKSADKVSLDAALGILKSTFKLDSFAK